MIIYPCNVDYSNMWDTTASFRKEANDKVRIDIASPSGPHRASPYPQGPGAGHEQRKECGPFAQFEENQSCPTQWQARWGQVA